MYQMRNRRKKSQPQQSKKVKVPGFVLKDLGLTRKEVDEASDGIREALNKAFFLKKPKTEGQKIGQEAEDRFLEIWEDKANHPHWFAGIRRSTPTEDLCEQTDFFILCQDGMEIRCQIKARMIPVAEIEEFFKKGEKDPREGIVCISVPPGDSAEAIRERTIKRILAYRHFIATGKVEIKL